MFSEKKIVVYVSRDALALAVVDTSRKKILSSKSGAWSDQGIQSLSEAVQELSDSPRVRIVFGSDVSYVLKLQVPLGSDTNTRKLLKNHIDSEIPEKLHDNEWDYFTSDTTGETQHVVVYAPVKEFSQLVFKTFTQAGIEIEASEPEDVSKMRNNNPLIGIALKDNLSGRDSRVLNVVANDNTTEIDKDASSSVFSNVYIRIVLVIVVLGALGIGMYLAL